MNEKKWKAQIIDWSGVENDDDTNLYWTLLSWRELNILQAAIPLWEWRTRWDNLPDETDIEQIIARIVRRLQGAMMLRQNNTSPCLLEYSVDGVDWFPLFDFSLCAGSAPSQINFSIENELTWNDYNNTTMTTYAGDITNVYPIWGYGSPGASDADRDNALCWALDQWADTMCEQAIRQYAQQFDSVRAGAEGVADSMLALGAIANAAAVFGVFPVALVIGGLALVLGRVLLPGAVDLIISLFGQYGDEPFTDELARDDWVCSMYASLSGATVSFANWSAALSTAAGLAGNAGIIGQYIQALSDHETLMVQWYGLFSDMIDIAAASPLPCPCTGWCVTFDFVSGSHGSQWQAAVSGDNYLNVEPRADTEPAAIYTPSVGWEYSDHRKDTDTTAPNQQIRAALIRYHWGSPVDIDSVTMTYDLTTGNSGDSVFIFGKGSTINTLLYQYSDLSPENGVFRTFTDNTARTGVYGLGIYSRSSANEWSGYANVRRVTIRGTGALPAVFSGLPSC